MTTPASGLAIHPLTGTIGAEVRGVDLSSLDDQAFAEIRTALLQYMVLFFRDQDLTLEEHRDFGLRFGSLHVHANYPGHERVPEVLPIDREAEQSPEGIASQHRDLAALRWDSTGTWRTVGADEWHTDASYEECPPLGSILYGRVVPPVGGDTLWANQCAAYETLSAGMKGYLDELLAVHSDIAQKTRIGTQDPLIVNEHPVVRTHPETGRKSLFVNPYYTQRIKGVSRGESDGILAFLVSHAVRPEFCCRFRWEEGSIAFWDNRCTMHSAVDDCSGYPRSMQRVTLEGDRPY